MSGSHHSFLRMIAYLAVAAASLTSASAGLWEYPHGSTVSNPRIPAVDPTGEGARGAAMQVAADFTYLLAPFVVFEDGGVLEAQLRDTPRRLEKNVLTLVSDRQRLELVFLPASQERTPVLRYSENGVQLWEKAVGKHWGESWKAFRLAWSRDELEVQVRDGTELSFAFPEGFNPTRVSLKSHLVDELRITGGGDFNLGWETGYAARIEPVAGGERSRARLFGFDTYAVSQASEARDFPLIQVSNGSREAKTYRFDFQMQREIGGQSVKWTQELTAEAGLSRMEPIRFPGGLQSDVYHLAVRGTEDLDGYEETKHFFYAEPRNEESGTPKFGLHDSNNRRFGFWPDALGIDFAHAYAYWGYVVGPAWVRDFKGGYGIDPNTPPEQWAWNQRVDWHLGQGHEVYLSLQSEPLQVWMRDHTYPEQRIKHFNWGERGGFPQLELYQRFVRELCERYAGKIRYFEIENEPNAGGRDQIPPEEYARIARATYEAIHRVIPGARVFGICGTGSFEPWMEAVFEAGGAAYMDGVSIHTYVTPQMPEQADLPGKLAEVNRLIDSTGRDLPIINSETGTYIALREEVDRPISEARLETLIEKGTPTIVVARGWPNYAMSELQGSASIVRNAIYNFLGGAERFVFFGWNPDWPAIEPGADWMTGAIDKVASGFGMLSLSRNGERTPGWHTLAVGVLVEQLNGADLEGIREIDRGGIRGAVFQKRGGGEVAVLWSPLGTRTALFGAESNSVEQVTMLGQSHHTVLPEGGSFALELNGEPIYLHLDRPGLSIRTSPLLNIRQIDRADGDVEVAFTLVNRETKRWRGEVLFPEQSGWRFAPSKLDFDLAPRSRGDFTVEAIPPQTAGSSEYSLRASLSLPGGGGFTVPLNLKRRPVVRVADKPVGIDGGRELAELSMPGGRLLLARPEQVVLGRPPKLTSIQEDQYWQGPAELSAEAKVAVDEQGLYLYLDVTDAKAEAPEPWPGVLGSAVELFFDVRSPEEGFGSGFGEGVYQILLKPALKPGESVAIHNVNGEPDTLAGAEAEGGPTESGYWLSYFVPWSALGRSYGNPAPIGFDVGINAPGSEAGTRKSQMMLFGTASNHKDASEYGVLLPLGD